MAGIYIHIPFCKQACTYCNFHFSTSLSSKPTLLNALRAEINYRVLPNERITSVYFGGGTPSLCSAGEISTLLSAIKDKVEFSDDVEITLECNPDDLTPKYLQDIKSCGVNRLSIGIQSFYDSDLQFMNRAHNADEAKVCIQNAISFGFDNITVDLIYGSPTTTDQMWRENVNRALGTGIHHLSSYALTVEEKTKLGNDVKKGKVIVDEDKSATHFDILLEEIDNHGFEQYEISNFCRENKYAKHNSSYWSGKKYIGIGPAAHSFDGIKRRWNVANNALYIKGIETSSIYWEEETLSIKDKYNEYIMTGLRTKWGIKPKDIESLFGNDLYEYFQTALLKSNYSDKIYKTEETISITKKGKFFADAIAASLFKI